MEKLQLSHRDLCPDWRSALWHGGASGLILRDYDAPQRIELAKEMLIFCHRLGVSFAIAGDAHLAERLGTRFHCPSYLIARYAARRGRATPGDSAAVHNEREIRAAAQAGFTTLILSPIFATNSHADAQPLGVLRARYLAQIGHQLGCQVLALGGMNDQAMHRLNAARHDFDGYAAISAFRHKS